MSRSSPGAETRSQGSRKRSPPAVDRSTLDAVRASAKSDVLAVTGLTDGQWNKAIDALLADDTVTKRFSLGWSHYVALLTIDDPDERRFYEIEAEQNHWSVRELERQIGSSLYERLALSRDREEIRRLSQMKHPPSASSSAAARTTPWSS